MTCSRVFKMVDDFMATLEQIFHSELNNVLHDVLHHVK
ncbi:hypothetical protein CPter91_4455 [Collimonas pratensis]|uniref:Uncharacterized protein n=1 Tax=Collimonas pratensis TaxID=279113 RepID=A0A127Q9P3_9BURK|nr:hypothetical protein CPter91_4455 [Collimonas pratensis]